MRRAGESRDINLIQKGDLNTVADLAAERRAGAVRALDSPVDQLRLAIRLGVPTGPDDEESRLLYELDAFTGSSRTFGILTSSYFDRQTMLYS